MNYKLLWKNKSRNKEFKIWFSIKKWFFFATLIHWTKLNTKGFMKLIIKNNHDFFFPLLRKSALHSRFSLPPLFIVMFLLQQKHALFSVYLYKFWWITFSNYFEVCMCTRDTPENTLNRFFGASRRCDHYVVWERLITSFFLLLCTCEQGHRIKHFHDDAASELRLLMNTFKIIRLSHYNEK